MTREETKKILKVLNTAYPEYFSKMTRAEKLDQIDLYQTIFGDFPAEIIVSAVCSYIKVNEYRPTIAGLQKQIDLITAEDEGAADLWNVLAEACRKGSILTQQEFDALPWPVKRWCGNIGQIKELAMTKSDIFHTVIRGQFLRAVPQLIERERAFGQLSEGVRQELKTEIKSLTEKSYRAI